MPAKVRLEARLPFIHPELVVVVDPLGELRLPLIERYVEDAEAVLVVPNADRFDGDVFALDVVDAERVCIRMGQIFVHLTSDMPEFHELVLPDLVAQREKPLPLPAPRIRSELSQLTIDRVQRAAVWSQGGQSWNKSLSAAICSAPGPDLGAGGIFIPKVGI